MFLLSGLLCVVTPLVHPATAQAAPAKNLILVTMDGVRTEEMFRGIDASLIEPPGRDRPVEEAELYKRFHAASPRERREKLMPFFWGTLMKDHGAIVGNRFEGNVMTLANNHRFSYPGYSEILTGVARDRIIKSNAKLQNPFPTVLDFFQQRLELPRERVAVFACWDVMDYIATKHPERVFTNSGFAAYDHPDPAIQQLSRLQFDTPTPWDSVRHDVYTFRFALAHLKTHRPRVLYIGLGETDDWAHNDRYDRVIQALHRSDGFIKELWEWVQSDPDYRDQTAIFFATDHDRGQTPEDWTGHGITIAGAEHVWLAAVGAGITPRGEVRHAGKLSQNQVAATLARSVGLDYAPFNPDAGRPIERFFAE